MKHFTTSELEEALRSIQSTIGKCEKVQPKLKAGSSQDTLLQRRIKAFRISVDLIRRELEIQGNDEVREDGFLEEYKHLLQTTNLQKGYQKFVGFFRQLRTYLQKELPAYAFSGNIVENNMDYSYFQFTNDHLKSTGLKIVIVFIHAEFEWQIWLSGMNRETQIKYRKLLEAPLNENNVITTDEANDADSYPYPLVMTQNPTMTDYIVKAKLIDGFDGGPRDVILSTMRNNTVSFVDQVCRLLALANESRV